MSRVSVDVPSSSLGCGMAMSAKAVVSGVWCGAAGTE